MKPAKSLFFINTAVKLQVGKLIHTYILAKIIFI